MTLVGLVVDLHPVALRLRAKVDRPVQLLPGTPHHQFRFANQLAFDLRNRIHSRAGVERIGAVEIPVGQQIQVALSDMPLLRLRLAKRPRRSNEQ